VYVLHSLQITTQNPRQQLHLEMANMTFHLGLSAFFLIAKLIFSTPQG
jgi:hypothetical protein